MKTRFILSVILALSPVLCALSSLEAQVPQGFNYQAIARDGVTGNPIANATIKVKLSVLSDTTGFYGGTGGVYLWEEEHTNVKTNSQGMFTIVLGSPTATKVQGSAASFSAIDWSPANLFVGTKIAQSPAYVYKVMGSAKLWSVPYALRAKDSEQWQTSGANIFRATGNVGIGTSSPSEKLQTGGTDSRIYLNSANSNTIMFNTNGVAAPSFSPRSTGTKLVLYPSVSSTSVDHAIGVSNAANWYSVPEAISTNAHRFYAGTSEIFTIFGNSTVEIKGAAPYYIFTETDVSKQWFLGGDGYDFWLGEDNTSSSNRRLTVLAGGNIGIGNKTPGAKLTVGNNLGGTAASATFRTNAGSLGATAGNTLKLASIGFLSSNNTSLGIEARRTSDGSDWNTTAIGLKFDVDNTSPVNNSEIWLTSQGKVGVGTNTPQSRLTIQTPSSWDDNIPIFEVKNKLGVPVLAVYNNGVKILVEDTDSKGIKGGFAIGGFDPTKAQGDETVNLMMISPDSIRFNIDNRPSKAVKGGFAIGSFDGSSKGEVIPKEFMTISPENSTSGIYNTYIGYQTGKNTAGNSNTFIGYQAGMGLSGNNSGSNIFIGYGAGKENYGGYIRVPVTLPNGWTVYFLAYTGGGNVAIGNYSGPKLYGTQEGDGNDNVFLGNYTGNSMTTGSDNVFIGNSAGALNITGKKNVFIGDHAGYNETGSNKLYIENSSTSDPLIYGDFNTDVLRFNGTVEINSSSTNITGFRLMNTTVTPQFLFQICGSNVTSRVGNFEIWRTQGSNINALTITPDAKIGFGITTPTHKIDVTGGAYCDGASWHNASDRNLKENFMEVDAKNIIEKLEDLPIFSWNYKSDISSVRHIGPVAQDFYEAFKLGNDNTSISTVDPAGIALVAIQEILKQNKEQQQKIEYQQHQIDKQQKENVELKTELQSLREELEQIKAALAGGPVTGNR